MRSLRHSARAVRRGRQSQARGRGHGQARGKGRRRCLPVLRRERQAHPPRNPDATGPMRPPRGPSMSAKITEGQNPVRPCDSRKVRNRRSASSPSAVDGRAMMLGFVHRPAFSAGPVLGAEGRTANAQRLAASPQLRFKIAACTNTASRRVQALVDLLDARRYHPLAHRVACSSLAGRRGKSRGSDPLRRPTNISAAHRAMQYDDACLTPLASLPLVAFEKGFIPLRSRGFSAVCVTLRTVTSHPTLDRATGTPQ